MEPTPLPVRVEAIPASLWDVIHDAADLARLGFAAATLMAVVVLLLLGALVIAVGLRR
jgi:hypothetical protein